MLTLSFGLIENAGGVYNHDDYISKSRIITTIDENDRMGVCGISDAGSWLSIASAFFHGGFFAIPIVNYPKDSNGAPAMSVGCVSVHM